MLSDKLNYKHNGHTYHLVKVEGAERYSVIRDGRKTRQISMACLCDAIAHKDHLQVIERLFTNAKN